MKAIRVQHTGGPEVLELADVPTPQPKPAEALGESFSRGCELDRRPFRDGSLRTPLPFIPGQEGVGS